MKTKLFIVLSLMAFIFIGCDKDDEKVLPEEQEQEQKQDDEEKEEVEEHHNGAYVLQFEFITDDGYNYLTLKDIPEDYNWWPADSFYARCVSYNRGRYVPYKDIKSYAKIDNNTIVSGDERYVFPDEKCHMYITRTKGEWQNMLDYMINQDRDKDTTNVWCGFSLCENNGNPYFVLGMLNPDSLVGKAISIDIGDIESHPGAYVSGFIFDHFTYKPHSNNLDSVYILDYPHAFITGKYLHGYSAHEKIKMRLNISQKYCEPGDWE